MSMKSIFMDLRSWGLEKLVNSSSSTSRPVSVSARSVSPPSRILAPPPMSSACVQRRRWA